MCIKNCDYVVSGILQASSALAPHRLQSPTLFLIIGLLVAQVPRNSFPVNICLILIKANEMRNNENIIKKVESNVFIVLLCLQILTLRYLKSFKMDNTAKAFTRLVDIMDELREHCPWDKKQTIHTLRKLTIEEMYELVDAISNDDYEGIKEEIGDIFLHLVFYARIGKEKKAFTLEESLNAICDKLINRHPHIYGDTEVNSDEDVKKNWEQIKLAEGKKSVLEGVPLALPAMIKAYRLQEKTATVGFEWEDKDQVWEKVIEEQEELLEAVASGDQDHMEEELGDYIFSIINYSRFINVDPEGALERVNKKFKRRFEYIEGHASKPLSEMTLGEMDALWNESKAIV